MITLYHCEAARSFRPVWALEEMGLPYELKMLPFPPRALAKEYLGLNPLGTIPFMIDGDTRMTESSAIGHYLATRYGPTPLAVAPDEPEYGAFLNWLYFGEATLTFPQTLVLRWRARAAGAAQSPGRGRLCQVVPGPSAGGGSCDGRTGLALHAIHDGRHFGRLRPAAG